jgi:hypothetical protein
MILFKNSLLIIGILIFSNCYNYLSEEIPVVVHPKLDKRIPVLSIQVRTPEGELERERIVELYTKYLVETGYFGRVISGGVRAPYHIDIYTAIVDEYENAWLAFGSGFFSIATAGLLPAFSGERRVLRAKIYREDKLISERAYSQKHTTLYGLVFMFIWERGIEEAAEIGYNKEKNLIHNLVEDLNIY